MTSYNHDPAVELSQAESIVREWLPFTRDGEAACWVMVEYDRRGAEVEQLRGQRDVLSGMLREMARKARRYDQIGEDIARKADEEVAQLRRQRAAILALADGWLLDLSQEEDDDHGRLVAAVTKDHVFEVRHALGVEA